MSNKKIIIVTIIIILVLFVMCDAGSTGNDNKCDVAGCSRTATCTFGDMEMCTSHYAEWSSKAYAYNHKND